MSILMGVLTGFSVIRILKKQENNKQPTFGGEINVVQNIPGRLRMRSEKLKDKEVNEVLYSQLIKIDGLKNIQLNEVSGSILISYDKDLINADILIGAMFKLLGFTDSLEELNQSKIYSEIQYANKCVNYALLDKTKGYVDVKTLLPLSFITLATYKIITTSSLSTPSSLTLLWWAYNCLDLGGNSKCQ